MTLDSPYRYFREDLDCSIDTNTSPTGPHSAGVVRKWDEKTDQKLIRTARIINLQHASQDIRRERGFLISRCDRATEFNDHKYHWSESLIARQEKRAQAGVCQRNQAIHCGFLHKTRSWLPPSCNMSR